MFQRQGPAAYKADLSSTKLVCAALDHPERTLKYVHVAGTNGKGTVCHMVAAALQQAGHRVGLFTSPHLVDFVRGFGSTESAFPRKLWWTLWHVGKRPTERGGPLLFEPTFGMALDHFRHEACDIVVLETGMGGRLDSTNVIPTAEVCAVTNIGSTISNSLVRTFKPSPRRRRAFSKMVCRWCWVPCGLKPNRRCCPQR